MRLKLISQTPVLESINYVLEEKNKNEPSTMYVEGIYMVAEEVNKNRRKYQLEEMVAEMNRFNKELIQENRALGELEHTDQPTVNSERACHMIVEMRQEGNQFYGKSKVLSSTPMGGILRGLINDGVKMGMSTRALGQLHEEAGYSRVSNFKLITVDAVADPSAPGAFVDGILESKEWVLSNNGHLEEYYLGFEKKLGRLPKKDLESFLKEQISQFIKGLK